MRIKVIKPYKSLSDLEFDVPEFAVIVGPNGVGKSQLLQLIYTKIAGDARNLEDKNKIQIEGINFHPNQVRYISEWKIKNVVGTGLGQLQQDIAQHYQRFNNDFRRSPHALSPPNDLYREILLISRKNLEDISLEDFEELYSKLHISEPQLLAQHIEKLFTNYWYETVDLKKEGFNEKEIIEKIGRAPWDILDEIIKISELPLEFSNPSGLSIKVKFKLELKNTRLKREINFEELSSGEQAIISTLFYLCAMEKNAGIPSLLLLDEPDAHLHPATAKKFIQIIKTFVKEYGVKVIMTTHSSSNILFCPLDSLLIMDFKQPKIRKAKSKNDAVFSLTSGMIRVTTDAGYFFVEDEGDKKFYECVYLILAEENRIKKEKALNFLTASTRHSDVNESGGKNKVKGLVKKIREKCDFFYGLVDNDDEKETKEEGIFRIKRYCIENYLFDPILVYITLIQNGHSIRIQGVSFDRHKIAQICSWKQSDLQKIADYILEKISYDSGDKPELVEVQFASGQILKYPAWLIDHSGKDIRNKILTVFPNTIVNPRNLIAALEMTRFVSQDLVSLFESMLSFNNLQREQDVELEAFAECT